MFADVEIVVDGCLEDSNRFYDEILMRESLDIEREMAEGDGLPVQIYVTFHEHDDEDECQCIQYVTDGRPKYVFNMGDEKGSWQ